MLCEADTLKGGEAERGVFADRRCMLMDVGARYETDECPPPAPPPPFPFRVVDCAARPLVLDGVRSDSVDLDLREDKDCQGSRDFLAYPRGVEGEDAYACRAEDALTLTPSLHTSQINTKRSLMWQLSYLRGSDDFLACAVPVASCRDREWARDGWREWGDVMSATEECLELLLVSFFILSPVLFKLYIIFIRIVSYSMMQIECLRCRPHCLRQD